MADIRARDEALGQVDRSLVKWQTDVTGILTQANTAAKGALAVADRQVRTCASKVAALEALLASLGPNVDPAPIQRDLARAHEALGSARRAMGQIDGAAQQLSLLQRTHVAQGCARIEAARADLARRGTELGSYRASGSGVSETGSGYAGKSTSGSSSNFASFGLSSIDVGAADYSDNPIVGEFGRGGASRADYRWAVQTWDEVVAPGVSRGMTRSDFEARDAARNAPPLRRSADVYDLFLSGNDPILVNRLPNGTLNVTGGRHRLEVARELGIKSLPAKVFE